MPGLRSVVDGNEVGEGKGERKWEGGEVGRYYGGRGKDGRMGWERGCGGSGVEWSVRKEGRGCGGGLSIEGRGRLGWRKLLLIQKYCEVSI